MGFDLACPGRRSRYLVLGNATLFRAGAPKRRHGFQTRGWIGGILRVRFFIGGWRMMTVKRTSACDKSKAAAEPLSPMEPLAATFYQDFDAGNGADSIHLML